MEIEDRGGERRGREQEKVRRDIFRRLDQGRWGGQWGGDAKDWFCIEGRQILLISKWSFIKVKCETSCKKELFTFNSTC